MLTLNVPSGIGDISWLWVKISNLRRPLTFRICENNALNRASGFVDLLPGVENGGYRDITYHRTFIREKLGLDPKIDLTTIPDGEYYISANGWLDSGNRIEGFLPNLPANFHYPLNVTDEQRGRVDVFLEGVGKKPIVVIYTSKYNPPETGWNFYTPNEWSELCWGIQDRIGDCAFVFVGAKFDIGTGKVAAAKAGVSCHAIDLVGETEVGELVEILRRAAYVFAFPSGVGILCDVVDTPAIMFMVPGKHDLLRNTYADPENIASGRHINLSYCSVESALSMFEHIGMRHMGVRV